MNALIDGAAIETREQLHDTLAQQLSLPEYYGRNLDAPSMRTFMAHSSP